MSEKIIHHGGAESVTGSCHEWFFSDDQSIMIDCGLFQGSDAGQSLNFNFDVSRIQAVILTHAHIDHVGRLPWLIAAGYRGRIVCTGATAKVLLLVMEDALQIQLPDQNQLILQTLHRIQSQLISLDYGQLWQLPDGPVSVCLRNAGHIIGSAYVELEHKQRITVFSGDLGTAGALMESAPQAYRKADRLILESTYGNRNHDKQQGRVEALEAIIRRSLADGGLILIPAFSLGRTQELLAVISKIKQQAHLTEDINEPWEAQRLPVILDSPLASRLTSAYRQLQRWWPQQVEPDQTSTRNEKIFMPLAFNSLITIDSHREHKKLVSRLAKTQQPAIVLSASGMCQGGRIVNWLENFIEIDQTDIVFSGYQASGTLGREIQNSDYGSHIVINGRKCRRNAHIHQLTGFSAHADQRELIQFAESISTSDTRIELVHGEMAARQTLKLLLANNH